MKHAHLQLQRLALAVAAVLAVQFGIQSFAWSAATKAEKSTDKVDLNAATEDQLLELPGVGPAYAKKIIAGRPYKSVDELSKTGIQAARLAKILPLVTVKASGSSTEPAVTKSTGRTSATRSKTASAGEASAGKPATAVDLNSATEDQLGELPGVGPATVKKIIAGRPYRSVEDLSKAGIRAAQLAKIKPLVTVGTPSSASNVASGPKSAAAAPDSTKAPATVENSKSATTDSTPGKSTHASTRYTGPARTPPEKGMVWANSDTKVYHKEGSRYYGKTKSGKWMTEADAVKEGYRAGKEHSSNQ